MQDIIPNHPSEKINLKKKKRILDPVWTDYFTFSKRERKGLIVLLVIIIAQCTGIFFLHYFPYEREPIDLSAYNSELERLIIRDSLATKKPDSFSSFEKKVDSPEQIRKLFAFDPNSIGKAEWEQLGLSSKQAATIVNFVSKGGKFRMKEDLKKVYGFKNADYNRLQTYISLPDSGTYYSDKKAAKEKKKNPLHVDLAKADSLEILRLPGIGPGFTHRIIAYRNKLGGFYSLEQLHEVWGFSDSLYTTLTGLVYLSDTVPFNPLRINTISKEELKSHPYVGYKLAGLLINYRDQHGAFKSLDDFRNLPLITEENLRKLAPYLKFRD